jgi:hypothetical protein
MNAGLTYGQYLKISSHLSKDLRKAIHLVPFFEFHQVGVRNALERKEDRPTHAALQPRIIAATDSGQAEHQKLLEAEVVPPQL